MTLRRTLSLSLLASAFAATACGALLGIEDGILDTDASSTDASLPEEGSVPDDTSVPITEDAVADVAIDTTPPCIPDVAEGVDDGAGVFVAPKPVGADRSDCGDRSIPCASIQYGINRTTAIAGKTIVYVASGEYPESLKLIAGITIDGGWQIFNGTWARDCSPTPNAAVVIQAPSTTNVTVIADYAGQASLRLLTLRSKPAALPSETLYGIIARGATTVLRLEDVALVVAAGGDGTDGPIGSTGAVGTGACPPSDGGTGVTSTSVGAGADAGFFNDAGFVALPAVATGGNGGVGLAGTPGAAGACTACFATCKVGLLGLSCDTTNAPQSCGTPGQAGCPGGGGIGGLPGSGGGSSVGIFATHAKITMIGGAMQVGNGGAGGSGGLGGNGGPGANGMTGAPGTACIVGCSGAGCPATNGAGTAGPAGGRGGNGGAGARGGGGAGGYSVGIFYQGGDGGVTLSPSAVITRGQAGASRGNGASGKSADRYP